MPRYFFNLRDGIELTVDPDGRDLPSIEAVREEAARAALKIITQPDGRRGADARRFEIVNEAGERVLEYPFEEAQG